MDQIVKRKKKGRPPKADPDARGRAEEESDLRRSLRRRNVKYAFGLDDYVEESDASADDEEQRRREKKLKHLLRIQSFADAETESTYPRTGRTRRVDRAPAASASSSDGDDKPLKKRKIDADMDEDARDVNDAANCGIDNCNDEDGEEVKKRRPEPRAEDSLPDTGTPTVGSSGLPLPDKKALELILDKLQKKDVYGVYAEPVDSEELPDYHDVIEHPMDFATVRTKLGNGSYATLEQFESDVFLICSNAMQYNAPDTIYYKQSRSIKELAKQKFQKMRLNAERMMKEVKPEQGIRSGSYLKNQIKMPASWTVQEPVGSDFSSRATLATARDLQNITNAVQAVGSEKPGGTDGPVEGNSFLNDNHTIDKGEESVTGKGLPSRFVRKPAHDENRRATYNRSLSLSMTSTESAFSPFEGETKQLVPVGLYSDHSYARSLACFSATLGSVAWKVASKRIEQALPQGFKFGRGWIGEYEPLPTPILMLENCTVKEPPFLSQKVQPAADPGMSRKIPMISDASKECASAVLSEQKLPFLGPTGIRRPPISILPGHPVRGSISEMKQPFFLSPGINPGASPNLSCQRQNSLSRALNGPPSLNKDADQCVANKCIPKSSDMEASRSTESSSKNINFSPSRSSKQPDGNQTAFGGLHDGNVIGTRVCDCNSVTSSSFDLVKPASNYPHEQGHGPSDQIAFGGLHNGNVIGNRVRGCNAVACSSSDLMKPASNYPHEQGRVLSDPVQLMRTVTKKAQNQSNPSLTTTSLAMLSGPSLTSNNSNNAAVAAARAWMSVGAGGFRPVAESGNINKNLIYPESLYNSPQVQDIQSPVPRLRGEFPPGMHAQMDKNNSQVHALVPQDPTPMLVNNEMAFQHQQMVFPQLATAESRFQLQSNWRSVSPQMLSRQKQETRPPDLNIGFSSSGSPGRQSSGVWVDSQQPDLALQL